MNPKLQLIWGSPVIHILFLQHCFGIAADRLEAYVAAVIHTFCKKKGKMPQNFTALGLQRYTISNDTI